MRELQSAAASVVDEPASLGQFAPIIVDGKKLEKVAKRFMVARGQPGKLFGGKLFSAYLHRWGIE